MSGNMYPGVKTVNPLAGACEHNCDYCYIKRLKLRFPAISYKYAGEPRIDEAGMKALDRVTPGDTVFVCSMCDLFAVNVPSDLIFAILDRCQGHPGTMFLYQTKNPGRMYDFLPFFPSGSILACTIETDIDTGRFSQAPPPKERIFWMEKICRNTRGLKTMISIEPVMAFTDFFFLWFKKARPDIISIGAATGKHNLPEPTSLQLERFISGLQGFCPDVRLKKNLERLLKP